jgi:hypothetical protein
MLEIDGAEFDWLRTCIAREDTVASIAQPAFRRRLGAPPGWAERRNSIDSRLAAGEAVVIRGFGTDSRLLPALGSAMGAALHSPTGFGVVSTLEVRPFAASIAETTGIIAFHTDFASDPRPPDVVTILVQEPDPRHPSFGRNQVAAVARILDVLEQAFPGIATHLRGLYMPVGPFGDARVGPVLELAAAPTLRWPEPVFDRARLDDQHRFGGRSVLDLIEEAAKAVCEDVALDAGDLLVADNRTALHRRGTCSVAFAGHRFRARRIDTLRWFR